MDFNYSYPGLIYAKLQWSSSYWGYSIVWFYYLCWIKITLCKPVIVFQKRKDSLKLFISTDFVRSVQWAQAVNSSLRSLCGGLLSLRGWTLLMIVFYSIHSVFPLSFYQFFIFRLWPSGQGLSDFFRFFYSLINEPLVYKLFTQNLVSRLRFNVNYMYFALNALRRSLPLTFFDEYTEFYNIPLFLEFIAMIINCRLKLAFFRTAFHCSAVARHFLIRVLLISLGSICDNVAVA